MPIHLLTGRPGHGKTSEMVAMLLKASKEGKRPIYAAGIEGLPPGIATPLEDPTRWEECEDGALIFVDEAWKWFGHLHSAVGKATPPHVLKLAEHRHRGFDFVWTSQGPGQIYPFVRTLIEQHWHFVRRWGTMVVDVYKWDDLADDVKGKTSRELAQKSTTRINTAGWSFYRSATGHTIKARIPWKVWLLPVALAVGAWLAVVAYRGLKPEAMAAQLGATAGTAGGLPPAAPGDAAALSPRAAARAADDDLAAWLRPLAMRAPGLHGSQPIFDGREARAEPRTLCVISGPPERSRCTCYTEQVTPIRDVPTDVCRHVARHGEYDPFRAPPEARDDRRRGEGRASAFGQGATPAAASASGVATSPGEVGSRDQGAVWGRRPETYRAGGR